MRTYYSAPSLIDISVTKRCNLKCDYCSAAASPQYECKEELTVREFAKLFDEIDEMYIPRISLSGGEPFVRDDFLSILKFASEKNSR